VRRGRIGAKKFLDRKGEGNLNQERSRWERREKIILQMRPVQESHSTGTPLERTYTCGRFTVEPLTKIVRNLGRLGFSWHSRLSTRSEERQNGNGAEKNNP